MGDFIVGSWSSMSGGAKYTPPGTASENYFDLLGVKEAVYALPATVPQIDLVCEVKLVRLYTIGLGRYIIYIQLHVYRITVRGIMRSNKN